ncbi:MAG: DUF4124 domain-containing protein [Gammaproteobacteria bacterium]|nr:DUF4124 domain-containing protein [Gammaproteobacteria bacterium]
MMRTFVLPVLVATLLAVASAPAAEKPRRSGTKSQPEEQTYKWVNEKGEVQYGDAVPAQYSQSERVILNKQGVEIGRVDSRRNAQQAAEQARAQQEAERRLQHDQFLLTTYTSTRDIERLRDERLEQIDGQIKAAQAYIETLDSRLLALQGRATRYKPYAATADAPRMPDDMVEDLVRTASETRDQRRSLDTRRKDLLDVRAQFDADIARYKELMARRRS